MPLAEMDTLTAWSRGLEDPSLHDLPYKIETNEYGQIVMSPTNSTHGYVQSRISDVLCDEIGPRGKRVMEFPTATSGGVKVPDVVWISEERGPRGKTRTPALSPRRFASRFCPDRTRPRRSRKNAGSISKQVPSRCGRATWKGISRSMNRAAKRPARALFLRSQPASRCNTRLTRARTRG